MALKCSMIMAGQVSNLSFGGFNRCTIEKDSHTNILLYIAVAALFASKMCKMRKKCKNCKNTRSCKNCKKLYKNYKKLEEKAKDLRHNTSS